MRILGSSVGTLPEELTGRGKEPSHEEWAIYTALTLYAFHQQGMDQESMNVPGRGIGCAAAKLVEQEDDLSRTRNRFNRFALAELWTTAF